MPDRMISIADKFSRYPAGRTRRDGPFSAEEFRDKLLIPALVEAIDQGGRVTVLLDGVYGYSSSFLEETFGGLARKRIAPPHKLREVLVIAAHDPIYASVKRDAERYLTDELNRVA